MPLRVKRSQGNRAVQGKSWAALVLLVLVVLIPSITVGWLVYQASENMRLAMEKVFEDARKDYLESGRTLVLDELDRIRADFDRVMDESPSEQRWAAVLTWGQADGYVQPRAGVPGEPADPALADMREQILAELDAINTLRRDGDLAEAYRRIGVLLGQPNIAMIRLSDGRMIAPMLAFLATELVTDEGQTCRSRDRFRNVVMDPTVQSAMPPSQIQFCLKRLAVWDGAPAVAAAYRFTATTMEWLDFPVAPVVEPEIREISRQGELVGIVSANGEDIMLLRFSALIERLQAGLGVMPRRAGGRLNLLSLEGLPGTEIEMEGATLLEISPPLEDWAVVFVGDDPVAALGRANREVLGLVAVGVLVIGLSIFLSLALYKVIQKQARLAQLKNDLVATVSHELKTPVASIRLLVDTLEGDEVLDPVRVRDYLALISRENKRLGHLIENFLSFSRMERNKDSLDLQPVDPGMVAREAETVFRERQLEGAGELTVEIEDDLPLILADQEALQTAVGNLLENAHKYGGNTPRIALAVKRTSQAIEFCVRDNGIGISKDDQKRIFEKFYQSRTRLSEHVGGVGLGLSIVAFIVEKHGGKLRVASEPGEGSVFTLLIPHL